MSKPTIWRVKFDQQIVHVLADSEDEAKEKGKAVRLKCREPWTEVVRIGEIDE